MELNLAAREEDSAFDYLFDKFSQDIDEFQKTTCIQDINDAANHEDFTDTFFSFIDSRENNANDPSQIESIINLIQQDFEEFERAELPPCQAHASEVQCDEETREMIDELMSHETWEFGIIDDNNMCATQSYSDLLLLNHRMNAVAAYGSCDLAYPISVVRYFFCGQTPKPLKRTISALV